MSERLEITKTYKLFIGGAFPRSESGRSIAVCARGARGEVWAHIARASRKDLRDAVEAARKAQPGWANASAYNRGQVLYRMAEMLEGKRGEFVGLLRATKRRSDGATKGKARSTRGTPVAPEREVAAAIDRLVCFGGWADKYAQVLGCNNPVAGPYYNFTVPEPTGVVGVIAPDEPSLLGLISLLAPPLCAGNTIVMLGSESNPLPAAVLGEVCATSDVPAGVINILTGKREELLPHFASHRDIDAIHAAGVSPEHARLLREGTADNLKRVTIVGSEPEGTTAGHGMDWLDDKACQSPWTIEPFVEMKTMWHPSGA
jgi:acyl-CoA reductase-like NAD-dependent aldehyde dehydrogenase